jgi:hypothetical protein
MAERRKPSPVAQAGEAAEPAAGDVLEEDTLDRVLAAEGENLREPWPLDQARHRRGR